MATALITGAAKRIGKEISLFLARAGYNIALHYNDGSPGELTAEINSLDANVRCVSFKCDFTDFSSLSLLVPAVIKEFGDLEVLVNNASIFEPSTISQTTEALFDSHFDINLKAPFFLSQSFAKNVEHGSIINILDTKISTTNTTHAAYLLTKKALGDFTLMAAREFAPGIRVNAISPGLILAQQGKDQAYFDKLAELLPLKKRGYPEDVAKAVRFFIESEFITGETLSIDGGELIT